MSWFDILVPNLKDFKDKAGWSDEGGGGGGGGGESTTSTFYYAIAPGETVDIVWNSTEGASITKAVTKFPAGGFNLLLTSGGVPYLLERTYNALVAAGCTVDSYDWQMDYIHFVYTYNGVQKSFYLSTTYESEYTYEATPESDGIPVYALRSRWAQGDYQVTDGVNINISLSYSMPAVVGYLPVTSGASLTFDMNTFANFYDIRFDPDTEILHIDVSEFIPMTEAEVTVTT